MKSVECLNISVGFYVWSHILTTKSINSYLSYREQQCSKTKQRNLRVKKKKEVKTTWQRFMGINRCHVGTKRGEQVHTNMIRRD